MAPVITAKPAPPVQVTADRVPQEMTTAVAVVAPARQAIRPALGALDHPETLAAVPPAMKWLVTVGAPMATAVVGTLAAEEIQAQLACALPQAILEASVSSMTPTCDFFGSGIM